jgi:hypothetical protein
MPEFIDIDHITIRGGPSAHKFGDPYTTSAQGTVEHDRYLYISGMGEGYRDFRLSLKKIGELGKLWGWKGIRWERVRKDGTIHIFDYKL